MKFRFVVAAATLCSLSCAAHAQYVPDVLELDGNGGVAFASAPILTLPDGGTIEFWMSADWVMT